VRTVVVSDLHLGVRAGSDVARGAGVSARLARVARGADRLVLLGDVLELRERPLTDALGVARPLLLDLGGALAPGAEIVLVPGNHDHALVAAIATSVGGTDSMTALEQRLRPAAPHPLGHLAAELAPVRLELAYPGLWLDHGVYGTHGHYLDVHSTTPMIECVALAASARLHGGPPGEGSTPADYERIVAPVYRASLRIGRAGETLGRAGRGDFSVRLYERLAQTSGGDAPGPDLGDRLLARALPAAIGAINGLGIGPFDVNLSGRALRRAGLRAMAQVIERLGIEAEHVIFGHTHRAGPLPRDSDGWTVPARGDRPDTRLLNTGNWVYEPTFLADRPGDSPYWPGRCAIVEQGSPPRLEHALADAGHEELAGTG
jgi:hypothetical protein